MATIAGSQVKKNDGTLVTPSQGAWYDGQQYWGGTLSNPGQENSLSTSNSAGQQVSNEVIAQTDPNNVQYINNQIKANNIQAPVSVPNSSNATGQYVGSLNNEVEIARKATEELLAKQKAENDAKLVELRKKEQETLTAMDPLTTPFREELETTQREALHINENFEANQKLVSELDTLLTQGNELIQQQKDVTGLAAIRNPRIQKSMDDVAARAGVIQAVISARNGQISVAENMIDRSIAAITADRQDRLAYYNTILELNNRDIVSLDSDQKRIATDEVNIAKSFLDSAQKNADYFKQLLVNPATASLMGEAGVMITDSPQVVSQKLAAASYKKEVSELNTKMVLAGNTPVYDTSTVPANQLTSVVDSKGNTYYYKKDTKSGAITNTSGASYPNKPGNYTDNQWEEKIKSAITTINTVDRTYQTIGGKAVSGDVKDELGVVTGNTKNQGDSYLSAQEINIAYKEIKDGAAGNEAVASQLFKDAWEKGGFHVWGTQ